jgi:type IV pilus assembly protein PilY1
MHAFRDADGYELWSFIPEEALPYLQDLVGTVDYTHEYFMDSSPILVSYDYDSDGNIGPGPETSTDDEDADGYTNTGNYDKVMLIFGVRRGGGNKYLSDEDSRGAYYALDVTDPTEPEFLWKIENTDSEYSELGETWSEPTVDKVRLNGTTCIVAFIGAGYDNNEDLRFGDTQGFPEDTDDNPTTTGSTGDAGDVTSSGTDEQYNARGRGIYLLKLGYYDGDGIAQFYDSPVKLWEYVYDEDRVSTEDNPSYSFPTELTPLDTDSDDYIDRIYAGDTGGNMWRFDISNKTSTDNWSGRIVFSANPSDSTNSEDGGDTTNGRKIFYSPAVVYEDDYTGLYFGSGDRAHPQNTAVVDRLYAFYDRDSSDAKSEANMVNVTDDILQSSTADFSEPTSSCTLTSISAYCVLQNLYSDDYYGWFINLEEEGYDGEKVLASASVYNGVAYYTTYVPAMEEGDCKTSYLGESYLYAVDNETGEAIFNYDDTNDVDDLNDNDNSRADGDDDEILEVSDRRFSTGSGISSGMVYSVTDDDVSGVVGAGGGIIPIELNETNTTFPIYWLTE